jgi:anti-sigma factor RsiW
MTSMFETCDGIRRLLQPCHDGELAVEDQVRVQAHVRDCASCNAEATRLDAIATAVRSAASLFDRSQAIGAGLRAGIVSRARAERDQSLPVVIERMFEDMHLVWAGLGATAATLSCLVVVFVLLQFASPGRSDSLAAMLHARAGQEANGEAWRPEAWRVTRRVSDDGLMPAVLLPSAATDPDVVFVLSAIVSADGRLIEPAVLTSGGPDWRVVNELLDVVTDARFEPTRSESHSAVNQVVWLVARTTVRSRHRS